ncbi:tetratricopeptide repeat protein [Pandoraea sp. NPDC090278]|uniref:O-linked N-acetylglucosamine transferase, SPINDLY family protein n=1 Tax=Pandoraea sp. NPDC090278 TaxID=3364391 RepID=UPI00383AE1FA
MNADPFSPNTEVIHAAIAAYEQEDYVQAIQILRDALTLAPDDGEVMRLLGGIAVDAGMFDLAHSYLLRALELDPADAGSLYNLALLHYRQSDFDTAVALLDRAQVFAPDDTNVKTVLRQSLHCRASVHISRFDFESASRDLERLLQIDPTDHRALFNFATLQFAVGRADLAIPLIEKAMEYAADPMPYQSNLLHTKMRVCAWDRLPELCANIEHAIDAGQRACTPLHYLPISEDPARQLNVAQLWAPAMARNELPLANSTVNRRLRVGYFSHDFKTHPVSIMLAGMFEHHARQSFEVFAFATNPGTDDYRHRIEQAVEHFIDVSSLDDHDLVAFARQYALDIAVDITGLTQGGRAEAFATRMAPIQIQYLGYPGSSGVPNLDYVIVDRYIAPQRCPEHFSERLALMPGTFQISDAQRPQPAEGVTREHLGFEKAVFLFGCLCNTYKFNPALFDRWMRILDAVPDSALLLYAPTQCARDNLSDQAAKRNIDPARLHFSGRVSLPDYYANLRLIDLFLDTYPYNGGTTANDALWMGVPLLTCSGRTFSSRMAGSVLHAMGLDDMITTSLDDYERAAIRLATEGRFRLAEVRALLAAQRTDTRGVFSTERAVRALEALYRQAVDAHQKGFAGDIVVDG